MEEQQLDELHQNPPNVLFRRFDKKEYAEEFISGKIRLNTLCYYRDQDDQARKDECEGISSVKSKGKPVALRDKSGNLLASGHSTDDIMLRTIAPECYFISCFSMECSPEHRKWGKWVVKISDPARLFRELATETPQGFALIWGPVEYCQMPTGPEILVKKDIWRRKRIEFAKEREFRLALYVGTQTPLKAEDAITMEFEPRDDEFVLFEE